MINKKIDQDLKRFIKSLQRRYKENNVIVRLNTDRPQITVILDRPKCLDVPGLCVHYPAVFKLNCLCPCCSMISEERVAIHSLKDKYNVSRMIDFEVNFAVPKLKLFNNVNCHINIDKIDYTAIKAEVLSWEFTYVATEDPHKRHILLYKDFTCLIEKMLKKVYGNNVEAKVWYGNVDINIPQRLPPRDGLNDYEYLSLCSQIADIICKSCYEILRRAGIDSIIRVPGSSKREPLIYFIARAWVIWEDGVS